MIGEFKIFLSSIEVYYLLSYIQITIKKSLLISGEI